MSIAKQEVVKLYNDVKSSVSHAINDISAISLSNKEEQQHIINIKNRLNDISQNFNQEISDLETNSEWEKFTIAFFGETNAGKSTIIESLRIIFKEKERQKQIESGYAQLADLEKSFSENSDTLIAELNKNMSNYTDEVRNIEKQISEIKRERKPVMSNILFTIIGAVLGVVLMFVYQLIM
ncbi:MAG TPA: hypothetical protein EYH52_13750 [Acinetobacter venetianus]|uniref:hypothetical protein n=1 Tax=Acinetobacter venetianus TaxID=52133 RepID=UPI001A15E76F|nr:hypothetical protein [Acinetobacter venetianus]HIQ35665.1 hypothetical protein [Acinetobacter venetianus]